MMTTSLSDSQHPYLTPEQIADALGRPRPTPEQSEIISAPLTPRLVVAGAGSGKTATMVDRVVWLVANVYPTFTYADYPERWAPAAAEQLVENCRQYRNNLYLWFEQQLAARPWALGASVTLLDCYIAAMYRWGPRQAWFDDHAPKFAAIARAVCQRPELAVALRRNKLI